GGHFARLQSQGCHAVVRLIDGGNFVVDDGDAAAPSEFLQEVDEKLVFNVVREVVTKDRNALRVPWKRPILIHHDGADITIFFRLIAVEGKFAGKAGHFRRQVLAECKIEHPARTPKKTKAELPSRPRGGVKVLQINLENAMKKYRQWHGGS